MGSAFSITINFSSGSPFVANPSIPSGFPFFGFAAAGSDITSVIILGNDSTFNFALDNFSVTPISTPTAVPEPASLLLLGVGLAVALRLRGSNAGAQQPPGANSCR